MDSSDLSDCNSLPGAGAAVANLPTRQKNALRLLLDKPDITPEEVAAIDYRVLVGAPGIGQKGLDVIGAWLSVHGYELKNLPTTTLMPREIYRKRKLERAIDYLRGHGYEVRLSD